MSMDRGFQKWLSKRGLQTGTIRMLEQECILHENTLKLLTSADLEGLKRRHHMTMGQFVLLRTAHSDLLGAEGDGFDVIVMDDLPPPAAEGSRSGRGSRRNSTGERYRVKEKSTKDLVSDNLAKAADREVKLEKAADISERVLSSADEYSRLVSMLAEKKRRESGRGLFGRRPKSSPSLEAGSRVSTGTRPSSVGASNYDHLDNFSPPPQPSAPSRQNHIQLESDSKDASSGVRERHKRQSRNGQYQDKQDSTDSGEETSKGNCCVIL